MEGRLNNNVLPVLEPLPVFGTIFDEARGYDPDVSSREG
jgi:hypothetical protein